MLEHLLILVDFTNIQFIPSYELTEPLSQAYQDLIACITFGSTLSFAYIFTQDFGLTSEQPYRFTCHSTFLVVKPKKILYNNLRFVGL